MNKCIICKEPLGKKKREVNLCANCENITLREYLKRQIKGEEENE